MKAYLAARYSRRAEMEVHAGRLKEAGFEITSRWVYGAEDHLGLDEEGIALMDLEDVDSADAVISFTEPRGEYTRGGGRHVEFGYGLARGKRLIIVGGKENVFHSYPGIEFYPDVDALTRNEWRRK